MQLSTQQQILVEQRLSNEKKSSLVAYLLWFFLGGLSAHRFYLGSVGVGIVQLTLLWGGLILTFVYVGIPMILVGVVWIFVDLFLIGGLVEQDAMTKRQRIMNEVSLTTRADP